MKTPEGVVTAQVNSIEHTWCEAWKKDKKWKTTYPRDQQPAVVFVQDMEGYTQNVSWNGTNFDAMPLSLAVAYAQRADTPSSAETIPSKVARGWYVWALLCNRAHVLHSPTHAPHSSRANYENSKKLKAKGGEPSGLELVEMVCRTDSYALPSVEILVTATPVASSSAASSSTAATPTTPRQKFVFALHTGELGAETLDIICLLLLCRAYTFVSMLRAYHAGELPAAYATWTTKQIFECADWATSATANAGLDGLHLM